MWQFVQGSKKEQKIWGEFLLFFGFSLFAPPHFFFHLRHRCVFVLLLKILEYEGERVFCGRALTVVLLRLRAKGEEGRSTLRLTMIITTFTFFSIWAVRRLWFQRIIIIWVSFRYEYEEEGGFFVSYLSQARLSCSRALCARAREISDLSLSLPFDGRWWCWRWLYNVIRTALLLNAVMVHCTKWVRSCLLGECIFSQQRERERKRESLSSGASSSASWRRWWPIFSCF